MREASSKGPLRRWTKRGFSSVRFSVGFTFLEACFNVDASSPLFGCISRPPRGFGIYGGCLTSWKRFSQKISCTCEETEAHQHVNGRTLCMTRNTHTAAKAWTHKHLVPVLWGLLKTLFSPQSPPSQFQATSNVCTRLFTREEASSSITFPCRSPEKHQSRRSRTIKIQVYWKVVWARTERRTHSAPPANEARY